MAGMGKWVKREMTTAQGLVREWPDGEKGAIFLLQKSEI